MQGVVLATSLLHAPQGSQKDFHLLPLGFVVTSLEVELELEPLLEPHSFSGVFGFGGAIVASLQTEAADCCL